MSLQSATFPEPKMDASETTMTSTETQMELPDTPDEEDLRKMSKEQVVALYKRAIQNLYNQQVELRECEVICDQYTKVMLSLAALSEDFNDDTAETTGDIGIMDYLENCELGDGTIGPWFKYYARHKIGDPPPPLAKKKSAF
jgi:hypothetical protein